MPAGFIHLATAGRSFHNDLGWITIKSENLKQAVEWFNAKPEKERRYAVKYGSHKIDADAGGWITGMVGIPSDAPTDVYAVVDWNQFAADAIKEKKQLYISPEIYPKWGDKDTGEVVYAIRGAALTNDPHLTELAPAVALSSIQLSGAIDGGIFFTQSMPLDSTATLRVQKHLTSGGLSMEVREKLCTMLGIESTADDDALFNAMQALRDKAEGAETEIEVKLSAAVAPKDSQIVELSAKVETQTQEIDKLKVELSAATEAAAAAANEKLALEADTAVEALIKSGKALPRERELLLSAYKKDPEGSKALWELRGEVITFAATGINDPVGGSIEDRQVAAYNSQIKLGKSAEDAHAFAATIQ